MAARRQLLVRARVDDLAVVDHDDAIGERQRRAPVRDEQRRARAGDPAQRRVDLLLDPRVDRRRRVVEQQDLGIREQRARERDPLALAAREREALLADDRVVAVRQLHDELVRLRGTRRGLDLRRGRVGPAERDVGGDRVGEEERVLEHHADAAAQRLERRVAHVDAVDRDRAGVHVVEARQQEPDGRLARTRAADERDRLARRDGEGEVAQHRLGRRVAERHVVEDDLTALDVQLAARPDGPARAGSSRAGRRCARRRPGRAGRR